ncbi:MAG: hypothetical protein ACK4LQ_00915 [Pararhodobacter sp.]
MPNPPAAPSLLRAALALMAPIALAGLTGCAAPEPATMPATPALLSPAEIDARIHGVTALPRPVAGDGRAAALRARAATLRAVQPSDQDALLRRRAAALQAATR